MDHFIQTIGVRDIHQRLLLVKAKLLLCKQQLVKQEKHCSETLSTIQGLLADVLTFWENPEYDGLFIPKVLSYCELQATKQIALQHAKEIEHDLDVLFTQTEFVVDPALLKEHYVANRTNITIVDPLANDEPGIATGERIVFWLTAVRDDFTRFNKHMSNYQRSIFAEHNYYRLLKLIVNFVLDPNGAFHEVNANYLQEHGFTVTRDPNALQTLEVHLADIGPIMLDLPTVKRITN